MNTIRGQLSQIWQSIQGTLFPWLREELGELTEKQQQLITVLEVARVEEHLAYLGRFPGRPAQARIALAPGVRGQGGLPQGDYTGAAGSARVGCEAAPDLWLGTCGRGAE